MLSKSYHTQAKRGRPRKTYVQPNSKSNSNDVVDKLIQKKKVTANKVNDAGNKTDNQTNEQANPTGKNTKRSTNKNIAVKAEKSESSNVNNTK